MTGDDIYKQKAKELADHLLPAFKTNSGIPMAQINLKTGAMKNWGWSSGGCSILSEFGPVLIFRQKFTPEDAIGSHAFAPPLEALTSV
jgi:hypothetical protein